MGEEKTKDKPKNETWEKILYHLSNGKSLADIEKALGLSYEEMMDALIENVDAEDLKAKLEAARDADKEFIIFKAYKKIRSSKPSYIS